MKCSFTVRHKKTGPEGHKWKRKENKFGAIISISHARNNKCADKDFTTRNIKLKILQWSGT